MRIFEDSASSYEPIKRWFPKFKCRRKSCEDKHAREPSNLQSKVIKERGMKTLSAHAAVNAETR